MQAEGNEADGLQGKAEGSHAADAVEAKANALKGGMPAKPPQGMAGGSLARAGRHHAKPVG